ncbi:MAG TPA: exopolyphosphatase, partial [Actinomycetota bacterium]|nr:exopolyphosphatase [Actinomycetota bacterium]
MRVAAIDVGTNSTRLLVAEELADGFRALERRLTITRLGEGVDERRVLAPQALERTLRTIADYAAVCGEYEVSRLRVTGTSAVRDAHNRDEFFEGVRKLTGTEAELLSGEAEARATFLG